MNDIWKKNLSALTNGYDKLKNELEKSTVEDLNDGFDIGLEEIDGRKVLYTVKEGNVYQLDSLYDSQKLMDLWFANQTTIGYMTKCIFFGFGNGIFIREILDKADVTVRILVYEPSIMLFKKVMENFDISEIINNDRVTIIVGEFYEFTFSEFLYHFVDYRDLRNLIHQTYPNYDKLFLPEVKKFDSDMQVLFNSVRATQDVMARYGENYFYNSVVNSVWFTSSKSIISFFSKMPKEIPVFIVASGPSLEKNIHQLKNAKGKGLILAADSAVRPLLRAGICPDMYVTVDGVKNYAHLESEEAKQIPVFCELTSNRFIVKDHIAEKFFINDLNPFINDFLVKKHKLLPVFSTGGSVANTAYSIVSAMGFKTIILVGQDLAYSGGKTHASGTVRGDENTNVDELEGFYIDGYYGDKVKTSYEFQLYQVWFEEKISQSKESVVYNATEGGANIKGAINISLEDAICQFCLNETDVRAIIQSTDDFFSDEEKIEFKAYMYSLEERLGNLKKNVHKGIDDYNRIESLAKRNLLQDKEMKQLLQSTSKITELIEKNSTSYYVQNLMHSETKTMLEQVYQPMETPQEEIIHGARQAREYLEKMEVFIDHGIHIIPYLLDKFY